MDWAKPHTIKDRPGTLLLLYIQPGASKTGVKGIHGQPPRLKIAVQAPPVEGAANQAVIDFLAHALRIGRSKIHLLSGEASRNKNLWVEGMAPDSIVLILSSG